MIALGRSRDPAAQGLTLAHVTPTTTRGQASGAARPVRWTPYPGPQTMALRSPADVIGYGGAAGGGKSDLILGMAGLEHRRALIFRREFSRLDALIDRSRELYNPDGEPRSGDSFNENLKRWTFAGGELIRFAAMQKAGDWRKYQGQAADLHAFDEATEFLELQVRSVIAWNRSARGQRCRVVLTFNPPTTPEGEWIIKYFGPWLDPDYAGPRAQPGELRWFTTGQDGRDLEVPPGTPGAKSRTFIPARLEDNPALVAAGYADTIAALPEPLRSLLRGDWTATRQGDPWAVIPAAYVAEATRRERPADPGPLSALGLDVARGGADQTVLATLRGRVVEPLLALPGSATPDGGSAAALALQAGDGQAATGVDVVGWGSSAYDQLVQLAPAIPINAGEGTTYRDRAGNLEFVNVRAAMWWCMREALDPAQGEGLVLPDDPELRAELTSPRFKIVGRRIAVESKEDVRKRLGRSTDRADAVIMAYWTARMHVGMFVFGDDYGQD